MTTSSNAGEGEVADSAWYRDTVSALAYSLASPQSDPAVASLTAPYNDLASFILHQKNDLPDYLRLPMLGLSGLFEFLPAFASARPFHIRPPEQRAVLLQKWKSSRLGFQRDFVKYYESLATLGLWSRLHETAQHKTTKPAAIADGARLLPEPELRPTYEAIVVGSGPGGAITACLLAEAGKAVLLIEEGPFFGLESCEPFSRQEMMQKYRNSGQTVALGANKVAYVEGRCVGGGSEINSGLYHRTPEAVLEEWRAAFRIEHFTPRELLPHFEACERDLTVSLMPTPAPPASLRLHEGAVKLGWKSLEVPRWFRYEAGAPAGGTRQSMTRTFIPRFIAAGGKLLPDTRVLKIRQASSAWEVEARHNSGKHVVARADSLFLSCGAVQTPALLRRSGIKTNIGGSLCLHPTVKVVARFSEPVNAADMGVPVHQVKEFSPRISLGCSISSPPYLALGLLDFPDARAHLAAAWPFMANYYAALAGEGQGTVRCLPGFNDPLVRFRMTPEDRRQLATGLRRLCEALFAAGATRLYPGFGGGPELKSPDDLRRLPDTFADGQASLMTIHLFASCPMGENSKECGADSFGRVHGFKNLFIADASLLCGAPGVNPQGTIMAIARRNALHFLQR
jgi:choline dehydrogenase-like flavoprotein